jgi:hypothetical protein
MDCNTGLRKQFADEVVDRISEIAKKHGLDDLVIQRQGDPVLVAARGCLRGEDPSQKGETIELVMHISPNLKMAGERHVVGAELVTEMPGQVFRAFDLSEMVARDSAARAGPPEEDKGEC